MEVADKLFSVPEVLSVDGESGIKELSTGLPLDKGEILQLPLRPNQVMRRQRFLGRWAFVSWDQLFCS